MSKPRLTLLPLICVMYLVVSGGPYGIEDAVGIAGPRLALLLCLLVPLTLSFPTALMAAELTALLPLEGGFYFWVKEALGPFAGFAEAYFTILYTAVDTAIYPVLFVTYITSLFPLGAAAQVVLAIMLVWMCGMLNAIGVRLVGYTSMLWTAGLAAPFVALVALGLPHLIHWQLPLKELAQHDLMARLGGALTVVIWNFCGWENLSVVAAEIENPQRNYLRAVVIAVPTVALGYILPLAVCLQGSAGMTDWHTGSFAEQGMRIGGRLLGTAIAMGGVLSSFAIFEAAMLWVSRLPFVLARESYLPASLAAVWSGRDVPGRALLLCCAVFTLLIPLGFITLVVFDVFFYMLALMLEMVALIRLRRLYPQRDSRFMIRGGRAAVYLVALAPLFTWFATFGLAASHRADDLIIATALAAFVWPAYSLLRRRYGGPPQSFSSGKVKD
ncbi:MAG: APC family permease [Deltaproteobacteria bacterium]|nr:APC family permease [Deltaproteobacteria bacterium]